MNIINRFVGTAFLLLAIATWSCSLASAAEPVAAAPKTNIVLILADDLGINDLSCYGRKDQPSPNLDRLAGQGMRFTDAYSAAPICSPSRAAILTGKCPARLNLTNFLHGRANTTSQSLLQPRIEGQLPHEEVTLAELLRQAGYATGLFGKWHLGGVGFEPTAQGFDVAFVPPTESEPTLKNGGKSEFAITAAAEKFIEENRERPFFCYVPHNNPHVPLQAAPELVEKHRDAFNPIYAAMVETLDDAVGRLVAKIDSLGLADRTIVIFTSDNGGVHVLEYPHSPGTHNTPYRAGKGFLYEGGIREPLIVRWPKTIKAESVCNSPVLLTDLFPTLLNVAGIDIKTAVSPVDGVNITPLLHGETMPVRTLCWHLPNYTNQGGRPSSAIREGDWKLVEQFEEASKELYNLAADPGEEHDLATAEPAPAELLGKLQAWRTAVGARMPVPNPNFDADLHRRLYIDRDPSRLKAAPTAAEMWHEWKPWRDEMNKAIKGLHPLVTPDAGDARLHARDAQIHGKTLRYESAQNKDVLGYWSIQVIGLSGTFYLKTPGEYEVEVQQGCGQGSGGAEVAVEIDDQTLKFIVRDYRWLSELDSPTGRQCETRGRQTFAGSKAAIEAWRCRDGPATRGGSSRRLRRASRSASKGSAVVTAVTCQNPCLHCGLRSCSSI